jgi:exfoliative toxin A/B
LSGSVVPTSAMATMVIENNYNHQVALVLWLTAIVLHLSFLAVFIYYRVKDFKFEHILPSGFIPPVVIVAVSFLSGELINIANALVLFGLLYFTYSILLPIMLYRYIVISLYRYIVISLFFYTVKLQNMKS